MNSFLWNLALAFIWGLAQGELSMPKLLEGFALGVAVLWLTRDILGSEAYCRRVVRLVEFLVYFSKELVLANVRVAYDVLTPTHLMTPGIIAVPLDAETDFEITLLANTISLTPGSLSLDVSEDRRFLYVHVMYISSPEAEKKKLKQGFERRILRILR